jgi:NADH-quinone oxidoreductase subunit H
MTSLDQLFVNVGAWGLGLLPEGWRPWGSIALRIGVIAAIAPAIMMYLTWLERKLIARMQNRFGPTRVGLYGLLQPLSDGLKMLIKEDIVPHGADRLLHLAAPIVAVTPAILLFAIIPFGRNLIAADLNTGLLYAFAVSSVGAYAIFMGGWASRSKFSLLGAMRAVAQIVSYEVPGVLSVVTVLMAAGTLSTVGIVEAQAGRWFVFTPWGAVGCLLLFVSGIAEVNRTPFDMPEAESELVGGFHTEYSGMKFALWYMAEFLEAFIICALTVTCFLGGWHGPAIPTWSVGVVAAALISTASRLPSVVRNVGVLGVAAAMIVWGREPVPSWMWFFAKTYALIFVLVWLRGTFPLPLGLLNILAAGLWALWPFPMGTLASATVLAVGAWALVRANHPAPLAPSRRYVLAD